MDFHEINYWEKGKARNEWEKASKYFALLLKE